MKMKKYMTTLPIVVLTTVALCGVTKDSTTNKELRDLPIVKIKTMKGKNILTDKIIEEKLTFVSFWATWCVPCLKKMKKLEILHHKYSENNFQVLGINVDDSKTARKITSILKSKNITFPVYLDMEQKFFSKFNSEALPFSILVSQDNKILWEHTGYIPGDEKEIESIILDALGLTMETSEDSTSVAKPEQ
jgi:thiol-disulfide isomerase/thioredoxin